MRKHTAAFSALIIATLVALIALGSGALMFYEIKVISTEAQIDKEELGEASRREQLLRSLSRTYAETGRERERLASLFVPPGETAAFIEAVERLARRAEVSLQVSEVAVEPSVISGDALEEVRLSLSLGGSWQEIMSFVEALETAPYSTRLGALSLRYDADVERGGWSANVSFSVLAQKKP